MGQGVGERSSHVDQSAPVQKGLSSHPSFCTSPFSGVTGHFPDGPGKRPWVSIDELVTGESARIVGAQEDEVGKIAQPARHTCGRGAKQPNPIKH